MTLDELIEATREMAGYLLTARNRDFPHDRAARNWYEEKAAEMISVTNYLLARRAPD
jgi:hypothetical protein